MPRVAAIGLDSADWKVLEWLLERGALPNIAGLAQRGVAVPLRNERLYRTSLVWEAFLTGDADPPSRFSGAMAFDPEGYASQKVGARPVTTFFDRLGGVRTLAFDVPYLSLAGGGDGPRISCWGGHIRAYPRAASPRGLLREIDARFGTHPAWAIEHRFLWHRPDKLAEVAKALAEGARRRAAIVEWLADRYPDWDLLLTVLSESHSAAEWFGHGLAERPPLTAIPTAGAAREHLKHVYQALDEAVGHIVAVLPDDVTVGVFSVHGSGANNVDVASTVLLPELLHRLQLGRPLLRDPDQREWRRAGFPPIVPRRREDWHSYMSGRRIGSAAARLSRWGRYIPRRTAGQVAEETAQSPDEIGTPRKAIDYQVVSWYRAAWPQMRAFALPTFSDGRVRVNLEGREAAGKVAAADYEQVCDEVERSVRACRDPRTGRSIVEGVKRPRASDPMDADGPDADLVIEWVDGIDALEHPDAGMVGPFPFHRMAGHTPDGFAFLAGPGTQPTRLGERDAAELPPALVSLLRGESATDAIPLLATGLTAG